MHEVQRNSDGSLDANLREEWRDRCKTDIRFLHKMLTMHLPVNRVNERVHGPVFDFYAQPDPKISAEEWGEKQPIKAFLHLDPRGTFKTSIKAVRRVQTMLNWPDARHLLMCSRMDFVNARVEGIAKLFVRRQKPTLFQDVFDDYCVDRLKDCFNTVQQKAWFTLPNRNPDAHAGEVDQPTMMAGSVESSMSGWHFEFLDEDDTIDNQNAGVKASNEVIQRTNGNISVNRKMLMPWGIRETSGTRYHPFDAYGVDIDTSPAGSLKTLVRAALKRNDGQRLQPGRFPPPEECTLLFPEVLDYNTLRKAFNENFATYMTQFSNDAYGAHQVVFPRELLEQRTRPEAELPVIGERFVAWRLAAESKGWTWAAGASGTMHNGRLWVSDVVRGVFTPSALAVEMVKQAKRHGEHRVMIERSPGAQYVETAIQNYGVTLGWQIQVEWLEAEEDEGLRGQRIQSLEPMLIAGRVLFSAGISCVNEVYRQLANFGMIEDTEIADIISRLAGKLPESIAVEMNEEQELAWTLMQQRDAHDRIHGLGKFAPPVPAEVEVQREELDVELGGLRG